MAPLRSLVSSVPRTILILGGVLVLVVIAGVGVGVFGAPSVAGVENRFGGVNESVTVIETDLTVANPNPIGVSLGGVTVNYTVAMNDIAMANGTREGLRLETGNTTLEFSTTMQNGKIPAWWVTHIRNGERTDLQVTARVRSSLLGRSATVPHETEVPTDIIGQFNSTETRPVNAGSPLVSDPILYINETGASWGAITDAQTGIDMRFVMYNPKTVPYTITEVGYEITMNDVSVGAGTTDDPYVIEGRTRETIQTTTAIRNDALDEWWVSHVRRNQVTDLRIDFYARIELPTGNTVRVPLDGLTYTKRVETDIFGTKDETAPGTPPGASTPTPMATGAGTESPGPGTSSPSPTPTETPRLVPTPTPTPAGGSPTPSTTRTDDATPTATPSPTDDGIIGL